MAEKKKIISLGKGGASEVNWGSIGGTLSDQTDLQNVLNTIPTNTSELNNDSGFITLNDVPAQVQSNWNESDTESPAYIQNKPTIPAAQVQSDWNQSDDTAVDYIKNKPTIPAVNDSTITIQQNGTTVGTFTTNDADDTTINLTGGGGNSWFGTQSEFDSLGTYDADTDYYISDKIDYSEIKNRPNLSVYATKNEVNTKNASQDAEISKKMEPNFMTQAEFDLITPKEGSNYFIEGQTVEMVVTFTDQTTATYNVVVD